MNTRRQFLSTSARSAAAVSAAVSFPTIIPRHVLGGPRFVPPSEKINIAIVGAGGKGKQNTKELLAHDDAQIVAIADPADYWDVTMFYYKTDAGRGPVTKMVEEHYSARTPNYKVSGHKDVRELLARGKAVDAIVCSTPDHLHAFVTAQAMRAGKHVYCEKPLTHNIAEARLVAKLAKETGLATQMGNSGHSTEGIRKTVEYLRAGAIGAVREAHSWVPASRWNPGLKGLPEGSSPLPKGLDWDLWLGPREPRAFHTAYAPVAWRDFWAFGCGALGDFGCHDMDAAVWAFDLPPPESVEILPAGYADADIAPYGEIGYYDFPARGGQPPLRLTWYSGGLRPPHHPALPDGFTLPKRGVMFVGEKGVIQCDGAGGAPRLFPDTLRAAFQPPEPSIPRSKGHMRDWLDAIKGGPAASSSFDYAARLTEITLVGVLSLRLGGKKIHWDAASMKAKGLSAADSFIEEPVRKGWEIA